MRNKWLHFVWFRTLVSLCLLVQLTGSALSDWAPKKTVEFIVMAGQGGGADKISRFVASLIEKHKLMPVKIRVVNDSAGAGGAALSRLQRRRGDSHMLLFTLNSFFSAPLTQPKRKIDILKFTPIARLGLDPFILWVHSSRKDINGFRDFLVAANKVFDWTMAGTSIMSEDELLTIFLNHHFGLEMRYHPRGGGGEVAWLLSQKVVDSTVNNPGEMQPYFKSGKTKPLAVFTRRRLPRFAQTPTLVELGLDIEYMMQRGVAGPPGMPAQAAAYYTRAFKKVYELPEWQAYRARTGLVGEFMSGKPLREYWRNQLTFHRKLIAIALKVRKDLSEKE